MNKENIYRIIGYNGEYDEHVKKAIRKLLKENHPDHGGDRKIFELINIVKKELEENRVPKDYKNNKRSIKNDDIDYLYCAKRLDDIIKEKELYSKMLNDKKRELASCNKEYDEFYNSSINLETKILSYSNYIDKLKNIKFISIVFLILSIITFIVAVITKKIVFLGLFVLVAFICVIMIHNIFFTMQNVFNNNRNKVNAYVGVNNKIRHNRKNQSKLEKEIHDLKKTINSLENDIRFYENLINNR